MGWLRRLRSTIGCSNVERTLDEEMRFHVDERTAEYTRSGLTPDAARREALRRFGSVTLAKERARDVDTVRWLGDLGQDVRYAIRTLRKTPAFTFVAIVSLALGIGANTAIFSLVNTVLLRTLPVAEPQRLVTVSTGSSVNQGSAWSYAIWDQIRQRADSFDGAFACSGRERFNLAQGGGETQPVDGLYVSADFFKTLGVPALVGRTFTAADDVRADAGGPADGVAVISYGMWQRRFGGAATAIGTPLVLDGVPFTVIGVAPPEFFGVEIGRAFDVAVPIGAEPLFRGRNTALDNRGFSFLSIVLRLKPRQSLDAATAVLRGVQPQIRAGAMPPNWPPRFQQQFLNRPLTLVPAAAGSSSLRRQYGRPLLTISVVVALVLLIACANLANLMLARTIARRHELSVRLALGAPRWRVARQLLVESLVLAAIGALVALLIAAWGSRAIAALVSTSANRVFLDLSIDWRVVAFTAAVTIATVVLFGTAPAFSATRVEPVEAMKERGDRSPATGGRVNLSSGLVVAQVALSLVLVVAAGLFVRTFERLARLPLGFDSHRVLMVNVNVERAHADPVDRLLLYDRIVDGIAAVPGVAHAAGSILTPIGGNSLIDAVNLPGAEPTVQLFANGQLSERAARINFVTSGWFGTYGTAIRAGRDIDDRDTKNAPPVVVVNEAFVRKFFPDRNAIGATFAGLMPVQKTVVGVVGDAIYDSLRDDAPPTMYMPLAQSQIGGPRTNITISVRSSSGSPALLAPSVAAALAAVDRDLTFSFRPLADQVDASIAQERLVAMLSGFFGMLALLLAGLGLYGVTAYSVGRRRIEMGIRLALGAKPGDVVRLVLFRVCVLVALGVVIGGGVNLWASRFVATLLYGLEPRDLPTLAGASVVLAAVGLIAGCVPAWRASRIDPAEVLRDA